LRAKGISADDLKNYRKFGHDLEKLFNEARDRDLGKHFDSIDELGRYIPLISQPHKSREFYYKPVGQWELPLPNDLISAVGKLGKKLVY
jgi:hypothetical protein